MRHHRVAVLAHDQIAPFELGVAAEVFALPRPELDVQAWYAFELCAERPGKLAALGGFELVAHRGLEALADADTVIVPGVADVRGDPPPGVVRALQTAYERGARVVSFCSGAFALAGAGLLDGRRATTHWRYAELLARRFPQVRVDAGVLYVDEGGVLTSAGTAAGIDLCIHLVRSDHGATVANEVARRMVVPPHRDGGQAQFVAAPVAARVGDDPVARVMDWAAARLGEPPSVGEMAARAHLSPRQFARRFRAATGTSPASWLIGLRVRASLRLLESSDEPVEQVGRLVGFPTPAAYRRHFRRQLGVAPAAYRRTFRDRTAA